MFERAKQMRELFNLVTVQLKKLLSACGGWFQEVEQKAFQIYLSEIWC
jgi:hypothetical protein